MTTRTVILDGYTANPGDLNWQALETCTQLTVYERTAPAQVLERAAGAQALLTNKVVLNADTIAKLPDLRYIGVLATGYNVVDLKTASERGIVVTNVPAYSTESVAQATFALILELANRVALHDQDVHKGDWVNSEDFCFTRSSLMELQGQKLGIIGLGTIGSAVARIAQAFGMEVLAASRSPKVVPGITFTNLDTVLTTADVLTLHCPLTPDTNHLINAQTLGKMKSSAFLINTSRGPLIDEAALAEALQTGTIAGAGLDVLSTEPPAADNPLLTAPNCVITPHIAWATKAARQRLIQTASDNLRSFLDGTPVNQVN